MPSRVRAELERAVFRAADLQFQLRSGVTIRVEGPSEWKLYNEIFVDGDYDVGIEVALERARAEEPLCVVDLGANVGFFALRLLDQMRRRIAVGTACFVVSVEASAELAALFRARVESTRHPSEEIAIVQGRLGRCGPEAELETRSEGTTDGCAELLERLADRPRIDLLKCDIGGSELAFVEAHGELLDKVKFAVFELHHQLCDTKRCSELIAARGLTPMLTTRESDEESIVCFSR